MNAGRFLDTGPSDGATQMATDICLAQYAATLGVPTFRLYRWFPPCISLGFHQPAEMLNLEYCRTQHVDVVRRPTGGRAVLHWDEITYAIIIPRASLTGFGGMQSVYRLIGEGLVIGLRRLGIPAHFEKRKLDLKNHYQRAEAFGCFSAAARYEILADGKKITGSAQRLFPDALLQHGSLLTGTGHLALPDFLNTEDTRKKERIRQYIGNRSTHASVWIEEDTIAGKMTEALKEGMAEALSMDFYPGNLTDTERMNIGRVRPTVGVLVNGSEAGG